MSKTLAGASSASIRKAVNGLLPPSPRLARGRVDGWPGYPLRRTLLCWAWGGERRRG